MHGDEYRARNDGLQPGPTVVGLRGQVGDLKAHKGFDVTLGRRLVYPTSEVGGVAEEVLGLSRNGDARERLGEEIYDVVWNPLDLADLAGVDL